MTTFFRDFTKDKLAKAWEYAAGRSSLGHNVRLITYEDGERKTHRIYFSSGICNTTGAINVNDVPRETK